MSFRALSRLFMFCAALFLVTAGGLGLYTSQFISELRRDVLSPDSEPSIRAGLLRQIERSMGMRGAAGAYSRFSQSGDPRALDDATAYLETAEKVVNLYANEAFSTLQAEGSQELRTLLSTFASLYEQARIRGNVPSLQNGVQTSLGELNNTIDSLHDQEVMTRLDAASQTVSYGQAAVILALSGAFALVVAMTLMMRMRFMRPLDELARDMHDFSVAVEEGKPYEVPIWGMERQDEIGAMARAFERLRRIVFQPREAEAAPADGTLTVKLTGPSGQMLDEVLGQLRSAAGEMAKRGEALEKAWEDNLTTASESASRTTEAVDGLHELHQGLVRLLAEGRKNISKVTEQLEGSASRLLDAERTVRGSTESVLERLTDGADTLNALANSTTEHVTRTVGNLSANEGILSASVERAAQSSEDLAKIVTTVTETVSRNLESARHESIRLSDLVDSLQNKIAANDEEMAQKSEGFETAMKDMLGTLGQAVGGVRDAGDALQAIRAAQPEQDARNAEESNAQFDQLQSQLVQINTQMNELKPAETIEIAPVLREEVARITEGLGSMERLIGEALLQIRDDGSSIASVTTRFDQLTANVGASLTEIAAKVEAAASGHEATQSALARYHDGTRDTLKIVTDQVDVLRGALSERFETLVDSVKNAEASGGVDQSRMVMVEDLRKCVEDVLEPFTEDLAADEGAASNPGFELLTQVAAQVSALSERIETVAGSLSTKEEVEITPADLGAQLEDLREEVSERLVGIAAQLSGLGNAPDSSVAVQASEALSREVAALGKRIDDLGSTLVRTIEADDENDFGGLTEQLAALSQKLEESQARSAEGNREVIENLRGLAENIEQDARNLYEQARTADETTEIPSTDDLLQALSVLAKDLRDSGADKLEVSGLARTVKDVSALSDVISALEDRSARLARHVAEGGDLSAGEGDIGGLAAQILRDLQGATDKLNNIATAIAIASDADEMRKAS